MATRMHAELITVIYGETLIFESLLTRIKNTRKMQSGAVSILSRRKQCIYLFATRLNSLNFSLGRNDGLGGHGMAERRR